MPIRFRCRRGRHVLCRVLMVYVCKKFRRLCVGDRDMQERIESEALLAAVRTHGRTFDGVQYSPMGVISADTMVNKDT
ncbi:hypothetical protein BBO99_00008193 [Phytophthora kernoviae]|uniref:Uncharacterized protein n=2 Tax=Phytophthora kernoviae TaxID=325452 RepID=A0A3R7FZA2_9STRA|nr:hypothetical protein G195_007651 [Phytophthora kernoviae 00238/432]KAG2514110.1 hypothetical protein JM16_007771 [Phytophthora kernoviae]KAG2517279.1 hypothetical protein JM18_007677 [Phytophthora kernoviae]RLN13897.1 hypothetical protein BBI17_008129 [Phytophthora kernoviae]RLN75633.1 hypothetical protein BBO99_00008193 [Phytophthora kernoviae]